MTKQELQEMINEAVHSQLERESSTSISVKEYCTAIKESCFDVAVLESFERDHSEIITEGANINAYREFKKAKKDFKYHIKYAKKCLNSRDKEEAKKHIQEAKKAIEDGERAVKECKSTVGSAIFGFFAGGLLEMSQTLVSSLIIMGGAATGASLTAASGFSAFKNFDFGSMRDDIYSSFGKFNPNAKYDDFEFDEFDESAEFIDVDPRAVAGSTITSVSAFAQGIKNLITFIKDIKQWINSLSDKDLNSADKLNPVKIKLLRYFADMKKKLDRIEKCI